MYIGTVLVLWLTTSIESTHTFFMYRHKTSWGQLYTIIQSTFTIYMNNKNNFFKLESRKRLSLSPFDTLNQVSVSKKNVEVSPNGPTWNFGEQREL